MRLLFPLRLPRPLDLWLSFTLMSMALYLCGRILATVIGALGLMTVVTSKW